MINQFQVFPVLSVPRMIHLTHFCFLSKSLSNSLKSRLFSQMKVVSAELSVCVSSQIRLSKNALWPAFQMYFSQAGCHFFFILFFYIFRPEPCSSWLGPCGFGSVPQQHTGCFLVKYDPLLTHFLLPSHPAALAPGRQTIHPEPQRFPITHASAHVLLCQFGSTCCTRL